MCHSWGSGVASCPSQHPHGHIAPPQALSALLAPSCPSTPFGTSPSAPCSPSQPRICSQSSTATKSGVNWDHPTQEWSWGCRGLPIPPQIRSPPLLNPTALITALAKPCQMSGPCTSLCPLPAPPDTGPLAWGGSPNSWAASVPPPRSPKSGIGHVKDSIYFTCTKSHCGGMSRGGPGVGGTILPLSQCPPPGWLWSLFFGT